MVTAGGATAGNVGLEEVTVASLGSSNEGTSISATGDVSADTISLGTTTDIIAGGDIELSTGATNLTSLTAGGSISLDEVNTTNTTADANGGGFLLSDSTVTGDLTVTAQNDIVLDTIAPDEDVITVTGTSSLSAGGGFTADDIVTGDIEVDAGGDILLTDAMVGTTTVVGGGDATVSALTSMGDVTIEGGGSLSVTGLNAGLADLDAVTGDLQLSSATLTGDLTADAGGNATVTGVDVGGLNTTVRTVDGDIALTDVSPGLFLFVEAGGADGDVALSNVDVPVANPASSRITATGDVTADTVTLGVNTDIDADGDIELSNGSTGLAALTSGGSITLDGFDTGTTTAEANGGSFTLSAGTVDGDLTATARDDISLRTIAPGTGTVTVTGETSLNAGLGIVGDDIALGDVNADAGLLIALSNGTIGDATLTGFDQVLLSEIESGNVNASAPFGSVAINQTTVTGDLVANAGSTPPAFGFEDVNLTGVTVTGNTSLTAVQNINGDIIDLQALNGTADGDILLTNGSAGATDLNAGGSILLDKVDTGALTADAGLGTSSGFTFSNGTVDGDLTVTSMSDITLQTLAPDTGTVTVTGSTLLDATLGLGITLDDVELGDVTATAGQFIFMNNGTVGDATLTALDSVDLIGIEAGNTDIVTDFGPVAINQTTVSGDLDVLAGNLGFGGGVNTLDLTEVTVTGATSLQAVDNITGDLLTLGDVNAATSDDMGDIALSNGTLGNATLTAGAGLSLTSISGGSLTGAANNGDALGTDIVFGDVELDASQDIALSNADVGVLNLTAGEAVQLSQLDALQTDIVSTNAPVIISNANVDGALNVESGSISNLKGITGIDLDAVTVTGATSLFAAESIDADGIDLDRLDAEVLDTAGRIALSNGIMGDADLLAADGVALTSITGGNLVVDVVNGDANLTNVSLGDVDVNADNGDNIVANSTIGVGLFQAGGQADFTGVDTSGDLSIAADDGVAFASGNVDGALTATSADGNVDLSATSVSGDLDADAGGVVGLSDVTVSGATSLVAGTDVTGDDLALTGPLDATAGGLVDLTGVEAGEVSLVAGTGISIDTITADGITGQTTSGPVDILNGNFNGDAVLSTDGGSIGVDMTTVTGTLDFDASDDIVIANSSSGAADLNAGDDVELRDSAVNGALTVTAANGTADAISGIVIERVTGLGDLIADARDPLTPGAGGDIALLDLEAEATTLTAAGGISAEMVDFDSLEVTADNGDLALTTATVTGDMSATAGGAASLTGVSVTGASSVVAGGDLTGSGLTLAGLEATSDGATSLSNAELDATTLTAQTDLSLDAVTVNGDAVLDAMIAEIDLTALEVDGDLDADAGGNAALTDVTVAGDTSVLAGGNAAIDTLATGELDVESGGSTDLAMVTVTAAAPHRSRLLAGGERHHDCRFHPGG